MAIHNDLHYRETKIEAQKFEKALSSARERQPNDDVDPRVHQAMIEALESELAVLREQLAEYDAVTTET